MVRRAFVWIRDVGRARRALWRLWARQAIRRFAANPVRK
jgi:hypothetical protein